MNVQDGVVAMVTQQTVAEQNPIRTVLARANLRIAQSSAMTHECASPAP
jgi:hypothetical protein